MDLQTEYRGRRAATIENDDLSVTVLHEGGHIAAIFDKATGVNPLWAPPWPTIEPSACGPGEAAAYGGGSDARLLAGIMGHNLCLDIFGPPSEEEERAGLTAHGEGSIAPYELNVTEGALVARAHFAIAGLEFERRITLRGRVVAVSETLKNLTGIDRAIGWTQHVTLGPPFLECGATEFRSSAGRSKVFESTFGADDYVIPAAEFTWPMAPRRDGGTADLRMFTDAERSSGYTAHLMQGDPAAYFAAFSPAFQLVFGYIWNPADFPWMGIWEENRSRQAPPWNGRTIARGMEFGVSPMPETRQAMIERGRLFGAPCFRLIAAGSTVVAEYCATLRHADRIPESLDWPA
jgi:hypothetical protein